MADFLLTCVLVVVFVVVFTAMRFAIGFESAVIAILAAGFATAVGHDR